LPKLIRLTRAEPYCFQAGASQINEVLRLLYLHGLSSLDFGPTVTGPCRVDTLSRAAASSAAATTRRARATRELSSIGTGGRPIGLPAPSGDPGVPVELGLVLGDLPHGPSGPPTRGSGLPRGPWDSVF